MSKQAGAILLAWGLLALWGCGPKAAAPTPTVNESMTQVMAPNAQTIWDITSGAFNDKGDGLAASKISAKDWADLEVAGRQLRDRAQLLAEAHRVTVVGPGEVIMGEHAAGAPSPIGHEWDAASAKQVQAMIDAKPALFAQRAKVLADAGATTIKAAQAKDAAMLYGVSSNLDEVCDGCHQKFWGTDEPPPFPH